MVLQAYCERLWLRVGERLEFWEDRERSCSGAENNSHKFPTECHLVNFSLFGDAEPNPILMLYFCLTLLLWEQPNVHHQSCNEWCCGGKPPGEQTCNEWCNAMCNAVCLCNALCNALCLCNALRNAWSTR